MASTTVIPRTPLRHSSTLSYDGSSSSSADDHDDAGGSGFSWTSSSEAGCSFSTSPATSAFSTSPSSSRSLAMAGKSSYARRRASTSASLTLDTFARLNTLQEQDAESLLADAQVLLHSAPLHPGDQSPVLSNEVLQTPFELTSCEHQQQREVQACFSPPVLPPDTPSTPAGIHEAVAVEQGSSGDSLLPNNGGQEQSDAEADDSSAGPTRPALRTKLSKKLFLKSRERASSLSKLPFVRPRLERRGETSDSTTTCATPPDTEEPTTAPPRRRALSRLQDRFARSAPSTPPLTPSDSTDRVHLFRSRPSSIVLSGRGVEFNYFTEPASILAGSQPSSCNASEYQPALDRIGGWGSVEDLANSATNDVFQDALPQNLFDALLPREVRLRIFSLVVEASVGEAELSKRDRSWTASRAASERWIGEGSGLRELVKMSRVCREWRDLVFDGQLWQNVYLARTLGCDTFSSKGLVRLASHAGSFLRRLDLRGFSQLQDTDLEEITESCISRSGVTSLTYIDLSGCQNISTRSLHFLLNVSPDLTHLNVRGLSAVVGTTCYLVLSSSISGLKTLDISLCRNLLASALLGMKQPGLEELYAAKIPSMDSNVVGSLPLQFPLLSYLDIGYSRYITDEAFNRWPSKENGGTMLKGLRLSACIRLTDQTCINLVGKVSDLECLELASIGGNMRDGGLVKLIEACPNLRKLDLEDAINITDRVLAALTPTKRRRGASSALEHLNITNIPEVSETALVRLIKACPNLRNIEASNCFNVSDLFIKTFAHHVRKHRLQGAEMTIVDCRSVTRQAVKEQSNVTRPRRGIRDYSSRHFGYMEPDGRGRGLAECDESRIVVHSFWTWQQVDEAEGAARSLRTAKLAREVGIGAGSYSYPFTLRAARRASFGMRGERSDGTQRTGGSCVIA